MKRHGRTISRSDLRNRYRVPPRFDQFEYSPVNENEMSLLAKLTPLIGEFGISSFVEIILAICHDRCLFSSVW